jgi:hypothetical protein
MTNQHVPDATRLPACVTGWKSVSDDTIYFSGSMHPIVHTPGPWQYVASVATVRSMDDQMTVCEIKGWGYLTSKSGVANATDEIDANGRLIAAAPMMLAALRRIVKHQDLIGGSMASVSSTRHIAAQAIQHATGEVV